MILKLRLLMLMLLMLNNEGGNMKKIAICFILIYFFAASVYGLELGDIDIHGFVSQGYLKSDNNDFYFAETEDGTFQFNEVGLNFSSNLTDQLRVGIQFLSRDLGELGNNEIEIDWAYADYRFRNWLGIRAGKIKKPYGLYSRSRDIDAARVGIFLPTGIYDDVMREHYLSTQGVGIYGNLPGGLSYETQYGTVQADPGGGMAKNLEWLLNTEVSETDTDESLIGHLAWDTPLQGLIVSATVFKLPDMKLKSAMGELLFEGLDSVVSAEYSFEKFTIAAEYKYWPFKLTLNDNVTLIDQTIDSWHVIASYQFVDWFTLGAYYSESYMDRNDRAGDKLEAAGGRRAAGWKKDAALTTKFDINDYWVFKLEGHLINGLIQVTSPLNEADENWFLFAAKTTFSF